MNVKNINSNDAVVRHFLNFLFENDRSAMLPMVGGYLLELFTLLYNFWFTLLLKGLSWLVPETYTLKAIVAFASFFVTVYTVFYTLQKLIRLVRTSIWFLGVKICKFALGGLVTRMKRVFKIDLDASKKYGF